MTHKTGRRNCQFEGGDFFFFCRLQDQRSAPAASPGCCVSPVALSASLGRSVSVRGGEASSLKNGDTFLIGRLLATEQVLLLTDC